MTSVAVLSCIGLLSRLSPDLHEISGVSVIQWKTSLKDTWVSWQERFMADCPGKRDLWRIISMQHLLSIPILLL